VAVIDVQMTGMNGVEMCRALKSKPETEHIPVILLTAHNGQRMKQRPNFSEY